MFIALFCLSYSDQAWTVNATALINHEQRAHLYQVSQSNAWQHSHYTLIKSNYQWRVSLNGYLGPWVAAILREQKGSLQCNTSNTISTFVTQHDLWAA